MILMLAKGNSLEEAAQTMTKELGLKVLENGKTTVNGNPALVVISQQQQQQQQGQQQQQQTAANTLQVGTYLIQYNNAIYAIHGLSSAADFQRAFPTIRTVAEGFRSLTDPDKLNRKPDRVYVRQAPRAGTFRDVMTAMGMPSSRIDELGVVNSLKADEQVEKGALLKIIGK
jgi:predicted Zn-dependent protease